MNTDIMSADGRLTVGGILLFGLQPQHFIQNGCISFFHNYGTRPESESIDRQVIEGTLDYQVHTCLSVIKNSMQPVFAEFGEEFYVTLPSGKY